jgi:hypothetical protein
MLQALGKAPDSSSVVLDAQMNKRMCPPVTQLMQSDLTLLLLMPIEKHRRFGEKMFKNHTQDKTNRKPYARCYCTLRLN